MRRTLAVVAAGLMALVVAFPAHATEPSGDDQYRPLDRLTDRALTEANRYDAPDPIGGPLPLPPRDRQARLELRALRAANLIGVLRSQAHDALHILLDEAVSDIVHHLDAAMTPEEVLTALEESGAPAAAISAARPVALDFLEFLVAVDHLRSVTASLAPERVCPVDGPTWFRNEWHADRPWERIHKGVDMHAALGTPLLAVEDGVVIQANWHWLGGRQVYLRADSTGDVYYYAHLDYWPPWLWTGTRLEAGDYLGLAGTSGNADSPHLHLGWMPGSREVDLDNLQNPYFLMYELCV